jgi:hypothetical protein
MALPDHAPEPAVIDENKLADNKRILARAGRSFVIADGFLAASGILSGKWKEAFAGFFGWAAGLVGWRYGELNMEKQTRYIHQELGQHLKEKGVAIPETEQNKDMATPQGLVDKTEAFIYSHPSQVMNGFYSLVGLQFVRSALQHSKPSLLASGVLLITGALNAIFMPEKAPDPENPPQTLFGKIKEKLQTRPLDTTGKLFNLNQITLIGDVAHEAIREPTKPTYLLKGAAAYNFIRGNNLMGQADKALGKVTKLDAEHADKVLQSSARVIAAQPEQQRDALLTDISAYLSEKPSMGMDQATLVQKLQDALAIQLAASSNGAQRLVA